MIENEMVGWHHRRDGHEFEQAPEVGNGQGSLACCSPWGHKELYTLATELNSDNCFGRMSYVNSRKTQQSIPCSVTKYTALMTR